VLSKTSSSIQIQVHGDIGNRLWKFQSLKNFLKYLVALISIRYAKSIRCVGVTQSTNLFNAFRIDKSKISIIPVQLSLSSEKSFSKNFDAKNLIIGHVGRIHKERSCEKLLTILNVLAAEKHSFTLKIIGDGPGLEKLAKVLATNLPKIRVEYSGWIEEDVLAKEFKKLDILISTADFEAYGRSIREAVDLGISVLATKSSGVVDAAREYKSGLVHVLESLENKSAILDEFNKILIERQKSQIDNHKVIGLVPSAGQDTPTELARLWISLGQRP
jgi:glycosyltransferase involved in cell wall biosynthesis